MLPHLTPESHDFAALDAAVQPDRGAEVAPAPAAERPDLARMMAEDNERSATLRRRLEEVIAAGADQSLAKLQARLAHAAGGKQRGHALPRVERDWPMFSPEAVKFFNEHDGQATLYWADTDGPCRTELDAKDMQDQRRPRFTERGAPYLLEAHFTLPESLPIGDFRQTEPDHDGHVVEVLIFPPTQEGTRVQVMAEPAPVFVDAPETRPYFLSLDLTKFHGPNLRDYAVGYAIPSFAKTGPGNAYRVHATAQDSEEIKPYAYERLEAIGDGLAAVERSFGLKPGTAVHRIWVTNSDDYNAYSLTSSSARRLGTVMFTKDSLRALPVSGDAQGIENDERQLALIARHEAVHRIDDFLGLRQKLERTLKVTPPDLLSALSEHNLFQRTFGGHPNQNWSEAVATIFDDLLDQRFLEAAARLPEGRRAELGRLLAGLTEDFNATEDLKKTPMCRRLAELQAAVQSLPTVP